MNKKLTAENDAPHVEVQWAVDLGFAITRARDEDHARKWVKGYEDNPDAVTEGDPMPIVVCRIVITTPWTRPITPGVRYHLRNGRLHFAATCSGEPGCVILPVKNKD